MPGLFTAIKRCFALLRCLECGQYKLVKVKHSIQELAFCPLTALTVYDLLLIFIHLQESIKHPEEESDDATDIRTLRSHRGGEVLKKFNHSELVWSVEVEFNQSILIWHVATDICYQSDLDKIQRYPNTFMLLCELSTLVLQYMMYLLVICPFMLPM